MLPKIFTSALALALFSSCLSLARAVLPEKGSVRVVKIDEFPKEDFLVWLGHSTFLIKLEGVVFYTDPVFSERVVVVRRIIPFPVEKKNLPKPDFVVISHNHWDHLDIPSLANWERRDILIFVPRGDRRILSKVGFTRVFELDWGQSVWVGKKGFLAGRDGEGVLRVTAVKVKHFSTRYVIDWNWSRWNGYLVEGGGLRIFFAGDTAYTVLEIPPPDIALLPVGAWKPRWFMRRNHVSPCEAVRIAKETEARLLIPMHYGTFRLGLDTVEETRRELERCARKFRVNVLYLPVGKVVRFSEIF